MTGNRGGLRVMFFDFGGVLAEEGFLAGLRAIAQGNGLDFETFRKAAVELMFEGYVLGRADEGTYWRRLREQTGVAGEDAALRREILDRFVIRPRMLDLADRCRVLGARTAILSDQTNWLEELDAKFQVFRHFDRVFNSFDHGMSKRDRKFFLHALEAMAVQPGQAAFIDDSRANVSLARELGIRAVLCEDLGHMARELARLCPGLSGYLKSWPEEALA